LLRRAYKLPFHSILLGIYPIVALIATNLGQIPLLSTLRALIAGMFGALLSFFLLRLIIGNWKHAALMNSAGLLLFYSYGHIYQYLKKIEIQGIVIGRHRYLAVLAILVFIALLVFWVRKIKDDSNWTEYLNLIALAAVAIPIFNIIHFSIRSWDQSRLLDGSASGIQFTNLLAEDTGNFPDIYYIILDAYGREDQLKIHYQFDNSAFINDLESIGFNVASCSQANYQETQLSLASSLNMDYFENLDSSLLPGVHDRFPLVQLIRNNQVKEFLEQKGYTSVAFETGYHWSEVSSSNIFLQSSLSSQEGLSLFGGLSKFELLLIKTTALQILVDAQDVIPQMLRTELEHPDRVQYERVLFQFEQLAHLVRMKSPKFVFAHIPAPHHPFVFGPDGEFVQNGYPEISSVDWGIWSQPLYQDQIAFINDQVLKIVAGLIEESETPPIIIIQGDHGPERTRGQIRLAILNAYYLPGEVAEKVYEDISPQNSFRLIFDEYFGTDFGLQDDRAYYSPFHDPYDFILVPNDCSPE
jgi:hypothetical protein